MKLRPKMAYVVEAVLDQAHGGSRVALDVFSTQREADTARERLVAAYANPPPDSDIIQFVEKFAVRPKPL